MWQRLLNAVQFALIFVTIGIIFPDCLSAQTHGKISGQITDKETGEPLPAVNIIIKGTYLGAASDLLGDYFILSVKPGVYNLEASCIGYRRMIVENVRISVGHNERVNFALIPEAIEGEAVVVTAQRPELVMVKMDLPTAEVVLSMKEMVAIPVDDMVALLSLQPGIEFIEGVGSYDLPAEINIFGDDQAHAYAAQGISIRGGASRETLVLLDGMPLFDEHEDVSYYGFGQTAVEAMQVLTGGLNSEYGNAASGVVNVVTREKRHGIRLDFDGKYSPKALKHFGPYIHDQNNPLWQTLGSEKSITGEGTPLPFPGGWTEVAKSQPIKGIYQPEAYRLLWRYQHRKVRDYGHEPDWDYDATLSGQLPLLGNPTFLISDRTKKSMLIYPSMERSDYFHRNTYVKLGWNILNKFQIHTMGLYGETKTMNPARQDGFKAYLTGDPQNFSSLTFERDVFNPMAIPTRDMYRAFGSVSLTHTVSAKTFYKLQFTYKQSNFSQPTPRTRNIEPVFWIYQDFMTGEIYSTQNRSDLYDENDRIKYPYLLAGAFDEQPLGCQGGASDWAPTKYATSLNGSALMQDFSKLITFDARFDLTSQVTKDYLFQFGLDYYRYDLKQILSFLGAGGPHPFARWRSIHVLPQQFHAYMNHKLEFRDMIANVGLRFQIFDPNISWFDYVGENKYNEDKLYWRLWHNSERQEWTEWDRWEDTIPYRSRQAKPKIYVCPRLGISHPISVEGNLFMNYGIYRQVPDIMQMYGYSERHRPNVTFIRLGNPYIDLPNTTVSEIGYQHNIANLFVASITGYFKSNESALNRKEFYTVNRSIDYFISVNELWEKIRGFEISLQKPYGHWITGWFNYNYMVTTEGHYGLRRECEDPWLSENRSFVSNAPIPRPTARLSISLHTPVDFGPHLWKFRPFAGYTISFLYRYRDGGKIRLAYADPEDPTEPYVDVVDFQVVNATLEKTMQIGGIQAAFYVEVRNLFNRKQLNLAGIENMADYQSSLKLPFEEGEEKGNDKIGDYEQSYIELSSFWWSHFLNPRDWWFGIRFNFDVKK